MKSDLGKKKINQIFSKYKIAGAVWKRTVFFMLKKPRLSMVRMSMRLPGQELKKSGTHNAALVGIREIFIRALLCGAAGVVLAHNHPGGLPSPSREDFSVTDKVRAASEFIGIQLYDHIIVGQDSWFSFAKEGKLSAGCLGISDDYDNR